MTEETIQASQEENKPLTIDDLVYVSDIARPQQERVESLINVLRDTSAAHSIGHMILIYETEVDGKARLGSIMGQELYELVGKTGLTRAEELVETQRQLIIQFGVEKLDIGYEAGLKWSREFWERAK